MIRPARPTLAELPWADLSSAESTQAAVKLFEKLGFTVAERGTLFAKA
ncbi:MAG: hypothetical protein ACKOSQ_10015 [Planctomycetaceae bacterium]